MADELPPPEPQQTESEELDRLESVEDRIAGVEEELRIRSIEERLDGLEGDDDDAAQGSTLVTEGEGERELRLALAGLLKNDALMQAAAELMKGAAQAVKEWTGLKGRAIEADKQIALRTYYAGLSFSAFLLLVVSVLLWNDKLSKEVAAGLFGSLIGYWYGRDKPKG
jgi:hypothetical protein